jgi:hypothetical protein
VEALGCVLGASVQTSADADADAVDDLLVDSSSHHIVRDLGVRDTNGSVTSSSSSSSSSSSGKRSHHAISDSDWEWGVSARLLLFLSVLAAAGGEARCSDLTLHQARTIADAFKYTRDDIR